MATHEKRTETYFVTARTAEWARDHLLERLARPLGVDESIFDGSIFDGQDEAEEAAANARRHKLATGDNAYKVTINVESV